MRDDETDLKTLHRQKKQKQVCQLSVVMTLSSMTLLGVQIAPRIDS
jgi:hypothetical protein